MEVTLDTSSLGAKDAEKVFLLNFPNGKIKEEAKKDIKFEAIESSDKDDPVKKNHKTVVAKTGKMTYRGQNFGPTACRSAGLCQYYLGVLNKETGKMRLLDAHMINMEPVIAGEEESSIPEIPANLNLSFREKNDILTKSFGSSKKKKAVESRQRNQVKGEALEMALEMAVDHAMSQPDAKNLLSPSKSSETSSLIPPYNKDATSPAGVYNLDDIVSPRERDELSWAAEVFLKCERDQIEAWRKTSTYSSYVLNHLVTLPLREEARLKKATLLLYLQNLIKLYQTKAAELRSKDPLPDLPDFVKKSVLNKFTLKLGEDGRKMTRCMPARMKDKVISYILVLCLIIDEFQVDLGPLQQDLKISQQRLTTFVRALGCHYNVSKKTEFGEKTMTQTARLEVPLTFPERTIKTKKTRR
ncbi:DNA-directed RNA polymerase I subunit RPA49-like [Liolophura sinensis]|uniref:DNA-directed RNA polymerase I subunit RPA49-like n=1 Tax=Liolophura sinensis TaxID=3198878 RepID=UPI0031582CFF